MFAEEAKKKPAPAETDAGSTLPTKAKRDQSIMNTPVATGKHYSGGPMVTTWFVATAKRIMRFGLRANGRVSACAAASSEND